jgi:hypothetical protein
MALRRHNHHHQAHVLLAATLSLVGGCGADRCPAGTDRDGNACRSKLGTFDEPAQQQPERTQPDASAETPRGSNKAGSGADPGSAAGALSPPGSAPCSPSAEECDNKDNDCDGRVDEGVTRVCGPMTLGVCKQGTQSCTNGQWSAQCTGAVGNAGEGCDCTGSMTASCEAGLGVCAAGTKHCAQGSWGACMPDTAATKESCDNLDNDCDGTIDGPSASCAQGLKCIAGGHCVECDGDSDCTHLSMACEEGMCVGTTCKAMPKKEYTACSMAGVASGYCINNSCTAPKMSVVQDTTVGDSDGEISYAVGDWQTTGDVHFNDGTSSSAYYLGKFTGVKVAVHGGRNVDRGIAAYSICDEQGANCGSETTYDAYASSLLTDQVLWTSPMLPYQQHTVKVRATNRKNSAASGYIIDLDYLEVN